MLSSMRDGQDCGGARELDSPASFGDGGGRGELTERRELHGFSVKGNLVATTRFHNSF